MSTQKTLFDKIWDSHVVSENDDGTSLLYIDMHLTHEVTSRPGFESMRVSGRPVRRTDAVLAVPDHVIPTTRRGERIEDDLARIQFETLLQNCAEFNVPLIPLLDERQGIVHIIGPEQGATQPGITLVCGDSHTATHGAFGCLAFGIGSSEVEHVLSTQTLVQKRPKNMRIAIDGELPLGVTGKDMILAIIGTIGTAGGTGHVIEYVGSAIRALSMEGRMTVCNMTIEGGARAGLIAPDETTFAYVKGRALAPRDAHWDAALDYWRSLPSDAGASYDKEISLDANAIAPQRARRIGQILEGASFVDGGIIGGPAWDSGKTVLHLSGPAAEYAAAHFTNSPLVTNTLGAEPDKASALKMCFAAHTKGTTLRQSALELGLLSDEQFTQWVRVEDMIGPRD